MIHEIPQALWELLGKSKHFCLAIDGRCGAGKTTLAEALKEQIGCAVVHLDDFFLPRHLPKQGYGNLEKERLLAEVLRPLAAGRDSQYRKFDCHTQTYSDYYPLSAACPTVIEGSYALLPEFRFAYTHSVFLTVSREEQRKRILLRNGESGLLTFEGLWIPMEEQCFAHCRMEDAADLVLDMTE